MKYNLRGLKIDAEIHCWSEKIFVPSGVERDGYERFNLLGLSKYSNKNVLPNYKECNLDLSSIFVPQVINKSHWVGRMGWRDKQKGSILIYNQPS